MGSLYNLGIIYDNFVPYIGSQDTLIAEFAELNAEISQLNSKIDDGYTHELTLEGLAPYNGRCTLDGGGYCKIGNMVIFQIRYTAKASISASNYGTMFNGLPTPQGGARVACSDTMYQDKGANYSSEVSASGDYVVHNTKAIASGDVHYANGCYICEV